jgi:hypothetical protein
MHTSSGMHLRTRPDAFTRSLVDAVTVGPFLNALLCMKQARVRSTLVVPMAELAPMSELAPMPVATSKAA